MEDKGQSQQSAAPPQQTTADIGAIWVATGEKYINAAIKSAESAKEFCGKDFRTHIFTDDVEKAKGSGAFDSVSLIENPHVRSKVDYMAQTPFQKVRIYVSRPPLSSDISILEIFRRRFSIVILLLYPSDTFIFLMNGFSSRKRNFIT